jgi:hypothetical protein
VVDVVPTERLAELMGVSPDQLTRLDTRPRHFAFVDAHVEYHTVKLAGSAEVTRLVTDASGDPVDPAQIDEIARISRSRLDRYRPHLGPALHDLLARHPRSVQCDLTVRWADGSGRDPQDDTASMTTDEVQRLVRLGAIEHAELRGEPEILDDDIE